MTGSRRRFRLTALLMLAGAALGGCVAAGPAAEVEPRPGLRPAPEETYLALGRRLLAANEPALAMRAFHMSLTVDGLSPEALTGAGIAAQRQGMVGSAREYLERARDLAPDSVIAHNNLGTVLLALKDYHGARTAFRSAVALSEDGGDATLRRNLERAELALAAQNTVAREDPAATQRVVRLGSDTFRLAEKAGGGPQADAGTWMSAELIGPAGNAHAAGAAGAAEAGDATGSDGATVAPKAAGLFRTAGTLGTGDGTSPALVALPAGAGDGSGDGAPVASAALVEDEADDEAD